MLLRKLAIKSERTFKGASGGPRHCIRTPDCPLKLSCYPALNPTKSISNLLGAKPLKGIPSTQLQKLYASIGIGIVHFRPPDVPLTGQQCCHTINNEQWIINGPRSH